MAAALGGNGPPLIRLILAFVVFFSGFILSHVTSEKHDEALNKFGLIASLTLPHN